MLRNPTVYVVDDDPGVLNSLRWLLESESLSVRTFNSGQSFLDDYKADDPGCLILDMRMPGLTGMDVQRRLAELGNKLPIIMMTAYADVPLCVESFKLGVFDFIEKPANDEILLKQIGRAIAVNQETHRIESIRADFVARMAVLSPREQQVLQLVIDGKSLKQIALELNVGIQTAAKHRARMLEKLGLENEVELVRLVAEVNWGRGLNRTPAVNSSE